MRPLRPLGYRGGLAGGASAWRSGSKARDRPGRGLAVGESEEVAWPFLVPSAMPRYRRWTSADPGLSGGPGPARRLARRHGPGHWRQQAVTRPSSRRLAVSLAASKNVAPGARLADGQA